MLYKKLKEVNSIIFVFKLNFLWVCFSLYFVLDRIVRRINIRFSFGIKVFYKVDMLG